MVLMTQCMVRLCAARRFRTGVGWTFQSWQTRRTARPAGKSAAVLLLPLIIRYGPTFLLVSEQTNALRISEQANAHENASMREAFWELALEMPETRPRLPTP